MERNCLKCNKPFESTGPGNRLCCICNLDNTKVRSIEITIDPNALISSFNSEEIIVPPPSYFKRARFGKTETNPESDS